MLCYTRQSQFLQPKKYFKKYLVIEVTCNKTCDPPFLDLQKETEQSMLSRFLVAIVSYLYVTSAFTPLLAIAGVLNTKTDQQINKQINSLQAQINQLRMQQKQAQKKPTHTHHYRKHICLNDKCIYYTSRLWLGPYLNTKETFDGSKLIINIPTVRKDARILLQQYQLEQECLELGMPAFYLPRATFSGKLEGQVAYESNAIGSKTANINFSGVELDIYIQGNSWTSGYMALNYDQDTLVHASHILINHAFVTIGSLNRYPFYASIGQIYVPFGRYSSLMITSPVTLELGRTRAQALIIGYQQTEKNSLHAAVYDYQELANNPSRSNQNNQWGVDVGYEFNTDIHLHISGEVGIGLISNLSDSQRMQTTVLLHDETLHHTVQAIDLYGSLTIDPMIFIIEYIGALRNFNIADVCFANQGARPTAFHTEISYTFHTGSKSNSIGLGYDHTAQALALVLPQNRYSVFYNFNIWKDTNFTLEYRHDINYFQSITETNTSSHLSIATDLGKSDNVITVQFNLCF
ncbi:MAG: LbtU family siderophore porin [Coxiella endosymbiont of Dermacentor nuttalli]